MRSKSIYLVCVLFVLGLAGYAPADEFRWDNSSGDSLWRTEENWDLNKLPGENDSLYVDWLRDPTEVIIDADTDAKCNSITLSNDSVSRQDFVHLHMTGGTLNAVDLIRIGREETAMFTLDAGEVTCSAFQLGRKDPSKGVVYINGGTVTVTSNTRVPRGGSQGSELHLNGGILYTSGLVMNDPDDEMSGTNGWADITEGIMILTNEVDQTETIKKYVTNGWLTAYGVKSGELLEDGRLAMVHMDYDVTNPGKTTVWAEVADPKQACCPWPYNTSVEVLAGDPIIVTWVSGADLGLGRHHVFFDTDADCPTNATCADIGAPCWKAQLRASTTQWNAGLLPLWTKYYWRIDEAGVVCVKGKVWTFTTGCPLIPGDTNLDCVLNFDDYADVASTYGGEQYWPE